MPALKEGNAKKRKDGRWEGRFYTNGIRKYVYAPTKADVILKLNRAVVERDRLEKQNPVNAKMTLTAWMDEWLEVYKTPNLKASSLNQIKAIMKNITAKGLGNKKVSQLSPLDIEKYLNGIVHPSIRYRTYVILNECMNDLLKNRVIRENPCFSVKKPRPNTNREKELPTAAQLAIFFEKLKERSPKYYLFARFLASTGLRKGEALALEWTDIDFERGSIRISKAYELHAKKISDPKTDRSRRNVPLFEEALAVLRELGIKKTGEVFDVGKQASTGRFRCACQDIGFPKMNLHTLRHIFASRCLTAGIDGKVVQRWLGHAKYDMTINVYSHVDADFERDQIEKLNQTWRKK